MMISVAVASARQEAALAKNQPHLAKDAQTNKRAERLLYCVVLYSRRQQQQQQQPPTAARSVSLCVRVCCLMIARKLAAALKGAACKGSLWRLWVAIVGARHCCLRAGLVPLGNTICAQLAASLSRATRY